jgi:hypothetical protein
LNVKRAARLSFFLSAYSNLTIIILSIQVAFAILGLKDLLPIPWLSELSITPFLEVYFESNEKCKDYLEIYHYPTVVAAIAWFGFASLVPSYIIVMQGFSKVHPFTKFGKKDHTGDLK